MKAFLQKCQTQKTISAHLVLNEIQKMQKYYDELEQKYRELQHYSNKHQQSMQTEIKKIKGINEKLRLKQ